MQAIGIDKQSGHLGSPPRQDIANRAAGAKGALATIGRDEKMPNARLDPRGFLINANDLGFVQKPKSWRVPQRFADFSRCAATRNRTAAMAL